MSISLALAIAAYAASPTVTTDKDTYYLTENITISVQADSSSPYRLAIKYANTTQVDITELLEIVDIKTGTLLDVYVQPNEMMMLIKTDSNGQFKIVVRTRDTVEAAGIYIVELLDYGTSTKYSSKSFMVKPEKQTTTTTTTTETTTTTTTTTTGITTTETETTTSPTETTETAFPLISPDELDARVSLIMLIISILLLVIL